MRRIVFYGLFLSIAVGAVVLGFDLLVETDQERIEKVVDEMRSAASSGSADQLIPLLDLEGDGFEIAVGRDRERFAAGDVEALQDWLADALEWIGDGRLEIEATTVEISADRAHAYFRLVLERPEGANQTIPIDLTLHRVDDHWLATRFRALSTGGQRSASR